MCDALLLYGTVRRIWTFETDTVNGNITLFARWTAIPTGGPVAYYSFNGNADDMSGNGLNGSVVGPVLAPGYDGTDSSAYLFDGENDYIDVPHHALLSLTTQVTVGAWVNLDEKKSQEVLRKGESLVVPSYGLSFSATGDAIFDVASTQVRKNGYPLNTWFSIVGTFDGFSAKIFIDGNLENTVNVQDSIIDNNLSLFIGTRQAMPSSTVHGRIDEIRIFDRVLSDAEIKTLYGK